MHGSPLEPSFAQPVVLTQVTAPSVALYSSASAACSTSASAWLQIGSLFGNDGAQLYGVHAVAPVALYRPRGHGEHTAAPVALNDPAAHAADGAPAGQ